MNNVQANDAVYWAVYNAVHGAVSGSVDGAVDLAVGVAVDVAVYWAVDLAMYRVVADAGREDPDHPALEDFLLEAEAPVGEP